MARNNLRAECTDNAPQRGCERVQEASGRIVVNLPLPAKELSPNSRVPWRIYAVLKGKARDEGLIAALAALAGEPGPRWERCVATVQFTYPDRIRRDTSNSFAACKHFWDSLTDAGIWRDDQYVEWHILPATVDRERAGLVVTVEGEL